MIRKEKLSFRVKRKILNIKSNLLRAIVSLHKRDNNLIVYGGALDLFIDNAKHLFIYNNKALPNYRHVWLSRNDEMLQRVRSLGFECAKSNSVEGRRLLYRAGMVIYDNRIDEFASHELSEGAVRFELWHGVTVAKRIGQIRNDPPEPYIISSTFHYKYVHSHVYGDYVLATSRNLSNVMSAAFQVPIENIIISDQPRCHTLYMTNTELDDFVVKYEVPEGVRMYNELKAESRQKIIYMPTFRDADPNYIYRAIPDWDEFNSFLKATNIVLYLKLHRITPLPTGFGYSNIQVLDNSLDIYPLLPLFDRLITDYSSIMFDFALMHKPVIIYDFDIEEYTAKSRYIFKGFIELLKSLSEAKNYQELTTLMRAPDISIKLISTNKYYDCPGDISSIINFITTKL